MRILVVEDEVKVANALKEGLEGEGYDAIVAPTGEDVFFARPRSILTSFFLTLCFRDAVDWKS
jgi:DNA-binding response OmpR family regulator